MSVETLIEEILKLNSDNKEETNQTDEILKIIQELELKEEDKIEFKFVIESLIEISRNTNPCLTFGQIIKALYSNKTLYPVYYELSSDVLQQESYDEETSNIMKYFEENKEEIVSTESTE